MLNLYINPSYVCVLFLNDPYFVEGDGTSEEFSSALVEQVMRRLQATNTIGPSLSHSAHMQQQQVENTSASSSTGVNNCSEREEERRQSAELISALQKERARAAALSAEVEKQKLSAERQALQAERARLEAAEKDRQYMAQLANATASHRTEGRTESYNYSRDNQADVHVHTETSKPPSGKPISHHNSSSNPATVPSSRVSPVDAFRSVSRASTVSSQQDYYSDDAEEQSLPSRPNTMLTRVSRADQLNEPLNDSVSEIGTERDMCKDYYADLRKIEDRGAERATQRKRDEQKRRQEEEERVVREQEEAEEAEREEEQERNRQRKRDEQKRRQEEEERVVREQEEAEEAERKLALKVEQQKKEEEDKEKEEAERLKAEAAEAEAAEQQKRDEDAAAIAEARAKVLERRRQKQALDGAGSGSQLSSSLPTSLQSAASASIRGESDMNISRAETGSSNNSSTNNYSAASLLRNNMQPTVSASLDSAAALRPQPARNLFGNYPSFQSLQDVSP